MRSCNKHNLNHMKKIDIMVQDCSATTPYHNILKSPFEFSILSSKQI